MKRLWAGLLVWCVSLAHAASLQVFEPDSMTRIVEQQRGKPFVLMVWSLDCAYCQESMKALKDAQRRYGLAVVTVATDAADDPQAAALIRKKLAAAGLNAGNAWAFGDAPAEQLRYAIDPRWHGEMPRSYWFDAQGRRTAHSGVITPEVVGRMKAKF